MIGALAALPASPALAVVASYPAALDGPSLTAWLRQATDLAPEQVIAVSPSAATAVVARAPAAAGLVELRLRAEALTPEAAARTGLLAWEMRLEVDCRKGLVRPGETSGYAGRTSDGDAVSVAPAKTDWRRPQPGTALESAWRAVCDASFRPPLGAAEPRLAQAPAPPQPATPALAPASAKAASAAAHDAVARAPAAPTPPARRGARAAQVVSSPLAADTQRSLAALRARFGEQLAGLETRVEPAQVRGRTVYRGLVAGFASHDEATAFCQALKSRGQDCVAR